MDPVAIRNTEGETYAVEISGPNIVHAAIMFFPIESNRIVWAPDKWNDLWDVTIDVDAIMAAIAWTSRSLPQVGLMPEDRDSLGALIVMRVLGTEGSDVPRCINRILARCNLLESADSIIRKVWDPLKAYIEHGTPLPETCRDSTITITIAKADQPSERWVLEGPDINNEHRSCLSTIESWAETFLLTGCSGRTVKIIATFSPRESGDGAPSDSEVKFKIQASLMIRNNRYADMDTEFTATTNTMLEAARTHILGMIRAWMQEA